MPKSRVVVVTGGGSGMGRAIAQKFAQNEDIVYILGRREDKLHETAANHDTVRTVVTDVTDPSSVQAAFNSITAEHPTIDVLVNCAGGNIKVDPNADVTEANGAWKHIIDTNLTSVFNMIYTFMPNISRQNGRIINITSVAAFGGSSNGNVTGQAYSAAKAGVHGFSRTLANAYAKEGITVNCVAPGVIDDTGFFGGVGVPKDRADMYISKIPAGRLGAPDEIAAGVFFLASDEASYINGDILNISGGMQFSR